MAQRVTYVRSVEIPISRFSTPSANPEIFRSIRETDIPACYVSRRDSASIRALIRISLELLQKEILPVSDILEDDDDAALRNLAEFLCLGILTLEWKNGDAEFNPERILETINNTGRHQIPIDIHIRADEAAPDDKKLSPFLSRLGFLSHKYKHIQSVRLMSAPYDKDLSPALEIFKSVLNESPTSFASVNHDLWTQSEKFRRLANDIGMIHYPTNSMGKVLADINPAEHANNVATKNNMELVPRLPLSWKLYFKGFHSFEVGKALDSWVGRTSYRYYSERPAWLEDVHIPT